MAGRSRDGRAGRAAAYRVRAEVGGTSRGQVLAANVDSAVVAGSLRSRTWAGSNGSWHWPGTAAPTPVVLTKADLVPDADARRRGRRGRPPGAGCWSAVPSPAAGWTTSAHCWPPTIRWRCSGAGAGKSTLINELAGAEVLTVQALRDDGKGRHTSVPAAS